MGSGADQAQRTPAGRGLLGASAYFGLDVTDAAEKKEIQEAIGSDTWRGRYSPGQILDYCQGDVAATERLLTAMLPRIDPPRALLRGRYTAAVSAMEYQGTPIDVEMLERLRQNWVGIKDQLIAAVNADFGIYEGQTIKRDRFAAWEVK
jgi:DNA polymerase I